MEHETLGYYAVDPAVPLAEYSGLVVSRLAPYATDLVSGGELVAAARACADMVMGHMDGLSTDHEIVQSAGRLGAWAAIHNRLSNPGQAAPFRQPESALWQIQQVATITNGDFPAEGLALCGAVNHYLGVHPRISEREAGERFGVMRSVVRVHLGVLLFEVNRRFPEIAADLGARQAVLVPPGRSRKSAALRNRLFGTDGYAAPQDSEQIEREGSSGTATD
jgi:hypothetical protein